MLMASIVASMMMGGFLLTVTGDSDDDLSVDDTDADNDLYADDGMGEGAGTDGWGDLLSDLMEDDALVGGPEAVNAGAQAASFTDMGDDSDDEIFDTFGFEDDFAGDMEADAYDGPWTEDGTEIVVEDFIPGEDELILGYDADNAPPQIDLFGDAAGNALVFADGHLTFKVLDGDGLVLPEDVKLVAETDEAPTAETVPA